MRPLSPLTPAELTRRRLRERQRVRRRRRRWWTAVAGLALLWLLLLALDVWIQTHRGHHAQAPATRGPKHFLLASDRHAAAPRREYGYGLIRFRGHGPELWNRSFRYERLKVRVLKRKLRRLRGHRRAATAWRYAVASFYSTDGTSGGCGRANGAYTFASLIVPCGQRVEFCRGRACVTGTRTDSGPYIAGRSFDLSTEMASELGFVDAGVATLRWRLR